MNYRTPHVRPMRRALASATALLLALLPTAASAQRPVPAVAPVAGKPSLLIGAYDLTKLGYQTDEFFLSGTAVRYTLAGPAAPDGVWAATAGAGAPYKTRVVAIRPSDPAKFNGTVLVEWLNVTSGQDTPADWMVAHREILRRGYAYVAVSAQAVGVEGGTSIMGMGASLKKIDPARYGPLAHPGDAFSFDIFSQVGAALKAPGASGILGPLKPQRVIALGESQSAFFLTTYVNAVDPLARVYDGVFIHSRFGPAAGLDGVRIGADNSQVIRFRPDLRVPVLTLVTETDLVGAQPAGYYGARRPDDAHLRVWELAGAAHADGYLFKGAFIDDGTRSPDQLAAVFWPALTAPGGKLARPYNPGVPHHYVAEAAIAAIDRWVRTGTPPSSTPLIAANAPTAPGAKPTLQTDAQGLARGGVRTPWMDAPTMLQSGVGNSGPFVGEIVGVGEPFDQATLKQLYPGGKTDYLGRFTAALDRAIAAGHLLAEDRAEILAIAAVNYDKAP